jgi:membrane dipeptidase
MQFFDAHCDAAMNSRIAGYDFVGGDPRGHVDLPRLLDAGHRVQVFAIFAPRSYYAGEDVREVALGAIECYEGWTSRSAGRLRPVLTRSAVRAAFAPGPDGSDPRVVHGLLGLEGCDVLSGAAALEEWFARGVRLIIPAWDDNHFSGTNTGARGPLSVEGEELVFLASHLGVMVDVSHASDAAFERIAGLLPGPFVASHSNCRVLSPALRNLTDAQIRILADHGGAMGINLAPDFLDPAYLAIWERLMDAAEGLDAGGRQRLREEMGPQLEALPRPGLDWVARHVRHAMDVGGEEVVGLGCDLDGIGFTPQGIEGVQGIPLIADALRSAGLSERQVELVCWRNMAQVFSEVLPADF